MTGNGSIREIGTLFGPEMHADPYPFYHRLRSVDPVHWDETFRVWVVTRYADVAAALRDPRLATDRFGRIGELKERGLDPVVPIFETLSKMMLFTDPPEHMRLRGPVHQVLSPRLIESMRGDVQWIVDALIDRVLARESAPAPGGEARGPTSGRMDLIRDLAYPLPSVVIGEMLGVPAKDRERFRRWWYDVMTFLKEVGTESATDGPELESIVELTDYARGLFAGHREQPRDGLLMALTDAEQGGRRLTEDELVANCVLLLAVGQESTTNLIGNGMLALLRHQDQLRLLREDPSLVEGAVEEFLRYESPVQFTGRQAREDLEIGGTRIARGQYVMLVLGAANRDPEQFADPDRLDIGRRDNRHLAFGHGPHFCLGAQLARLEGQVAFETLLRRLPDLRLDGDDLEWRGTMSSRGLESLPVAFGKSGPGELVGPREREARP